MRRVVLAIGVLLSFALCLKRVCVLILRFGFLSNRTLFKARFWCALGHGVAAFSKEKWW